MLESLVVHAGVISDAPSISDVLLNVLKFLLSVVGIVAILAIVISGIRYLLLPNTHSATSVKKSLAAIIIGLILIMGAIIIVWTVGKFLT